MAATGIAAANTYKCTDAAGKVTYTDTACPDAHELVHVEDNVSIVDSDAVKALIAEQRAKAATALDSIPTGSATPADMDKLKEAQSLIKTAMSARQQLTIAAIIIACILVVFVLYSRNLKKKATAKPTPVDDMIEFTRTLSSLKYAPIRNMQGTALAPGQSAQPSQHPGNASGTQASSHKDSPDNLVI